MKALPALALLLLLAGAAQAGSQHLVQGSAVSIGLAGPSTQLRGPLGVVEVLGTASSTMGFHLEGDIRMEVDHETLRGYGVTAQRSDAGTDRPAGTLAAVDGADGRDNRQMVVFPLGDLPAEVVSGPSSVAVATPASVTVHQVGGVERTPESVLAQGLRVAGNGLQVHGSFVVALYEWDFEATGADGGTASHWTGTRMVPLAGLPQETTPAARDEVYRQAFLFVSDGVLTLPADGHAVAFLPSGAADVHGALTLEGVHADMASASVAQQVSADRFSIHGDLHVRLDAPADGRVPFQASGEGRPLIEVDGATLQWTGASRGWPQWATWAGVAALALLAPPAALGARRGYLSWEGRRLARGESLLEMEAYGQARRAVRPLLRSSRLRSEAVVIHVESLLAEGKADEALPVLDDPDYWTLAPALRDYLAARAQAILGNLADARDALARALVAAPDLAAQALAEPTLRPLIQETPEGYT